MGKKNKKSKNQSKPHDEEEITNDVDGAPREGQKENEEKEEVAKSSSSSSTKKKNKKKRKRESSGEEAEEITQSSFRSIQPPLCKGVLEFLDGKKFHTMTPVQEATIPLFLGNKDVAVQAVTGSGKTLAFLIPIIERLVRTAPKNKKRRNQISALVLSPTRELAIQTWNVCSALCKSTQLTPPLLVVGGGSGGKSSDNHRPVQEDLKTFQNQGSDIIIGTPGRMEDILTRYNVIDCSELDILILDEADVLLFSGRTILDPKIASILAKLPKMRRTGLFSATTTFANAKSIKPMLQRAGMRNPVLINVQVSANPGQEEQASNRKKSKNSNDEKEETSTKPKSNINSYTPTSLTNYYMVTRLEERISRLAAFMRSHSQEKMIVFFLTCACVDFYGSALKHVFTDDNNLCIELLHGKLAQKRREKAMERYREANSSEGNGSVLVCTDVAARGLDVPDVDWVIQVDPPQDPSQFVHRVGRSARAGRKGSSLVFLTEKEEAYVDLLANRQVTLLELPENEDCQKPVQQPKSTDDKKHDEDDDGSSSSSSEEDSSFTIPNVLPQIRGLVLKDRDMLEKGTKAFTSYIRAYKEHVCSFIFRFNSLDLGYLATAFCLLRLPKMPELNDCKGKLKHFQSADASVDIYKIPYLDKVREAARQKRLAAELAAGGKNAKQIKAEMRKAELLQKQKERRQNAIAKGRNPDKKRGRNAQIVDEWEDLAKEERLYKKLRRGKITKDQYETLLRGNSTTVPKAGKNDGGSDESSDDE